MNLADKEKREIEFWEKSPEENPAVFSIPNLINKFKEADIFLDKIHAYGHYWQSGRQVLELGAGQGWASCMLKHYHPNCEIHCSDIAEQAIQSIPQWEKIFNQKIDQAFACKSYDIPMDDESVDLVFCFSAAHHFVKQRESLQELFRILKDGGKILYLHEPVCRQYIYPMAKKWVNRKRPQVPEDLLLYKELEMIAGEIGLHSYFHFAPSQKNRSIMGSLYYSVLSKLPFLQNFLPSTMDLIFIKPSQP